MIGILRITHKQACKTHILFQQTYCQYNCCNVVNITGTIYFFPCLGFCAALRGGVTGLPALSPPYGNFFLSAGFRIWNIDNIMRFSTINLKHACLRFIQVLTLLPGSPQISCIKRVEMKTRNSSQKLHRIQYGKQTEQNKATSKIQKKQIPLICW